MSKNHGAWPEVEMQEDMSEASGAHRFKYLCGTGAFSVLDQGRRGHSVTVGRDRAGATPSPLVSRSNAPQGVGQRLDGSRRHEVVNGDCKEPRLLSNCRKMEPRIVIDRQRASAGAQRPWRYGSAQSKMKVMRGSIRGDPTARSGPKGDLFLFGSALLPSRPLPDWGSCESNLVTLARSDIAQPRAEDHHGRNRCQIRIAAPAHTSPRPPCRRAAACVR